jgi:hypothetical protein
MVYMKRDAMLTRLISSIRLKKSNPLRLEVLSNLKIGTGKLSLLTIEKHLFAGRIR